MVSCGIKKRSIFLTVIHKHYMYVFYIMLHTFKGPAAKNDKP